MLLWRRRFVDMCHFALQLQWSCGATCSLLWEPKRRTWPRVANSLTSRWCRQRQRPRRALRLSADVGGKSTVVSGRSAVRSRHGTTMGTIDTPILVALIAACASLLLGVLNLRSQRRLESARKNVAFETLRFEKLHQVKNAIIDIAENNK